MTAAAPAANPVTTDELVALSEEIAALARAGLPLDVGLGVFRGRLPRRLSNAATEISERLQRGESLSQALSAVRSPLSPLLIAVVEAGVRAGRLPAALEELASVARMRADLKRQTRFALIYPLSVLVLALGVTALLIGAVLPKIASFFHGLRLPVDPLAARAIDETQSRWLLAALLAAAILSFLSFWLLPSLQNWIWRRSGIRTRRMPVYGQLVSDAQTSYFAGVLAILLDHGAPLPESIRLAGQASGNRALRSESERAAERLERGDSLVNSVAELRRLPAAFNWTLVAGQALGRLPSSVRQAAESYRQRATMRAENIRLFVPVALVVLLAGGATFLAVMTLFYPWATMLRELSNSVLLQ